MFVCHQEETKSKFCSTFFSSRMSSCREAAVDKMIKCRFTQNIGGQTRSWFLKTDKTPLNRLFAYQLYMGHAFEKQTRRRTNHPELLMTTILWYNIYQQEQWRVSECAGTETGNMRFLEKKRLLCLAYLFEERNVIRTVNGRFSIQKEQHHQQ